MSKKLLLADDSVVIQKLVGLSFANEDIEIVSTDNGDDAVSMAREIRPDIVLADVVMPGLSGYEVCEAIRQDPDLGHTPVLLLTGTFEAFDEGRASAAGANGQITKPFEAQALVERVNEVMSAPVPSTEATTPEVPPVTLDTLEAADAAETVVAGLATDTSQTTDLGADLSASSDLSPEFPSDFPETATGGTGDSDFFDSSVTQLAASDLDDSLDRTPSVSSDDAYEITGSGLFGAPGEGASDGLDTEGGDMVLGQTMGGEARETLSASSELQGEDATIAIEPTSPLPPMASTRASADPLAEFAQDAPAAPLESAPASSQDPQLEGAPSAPDLHAPIADVESLAVGLDEEWTAEPSAMAPDLGAALDDALEGGAPPTIIAGTDDVNASTARSLAHTADPISTATGDFEDLTVHVPSSDIDNDGATAPSPEVEVGDPSSAFEPNGDPAVVADLDAALDAQPTDSPMGATKSAAAHGEDTIVNLPDPADPLGLSPSNVAAGDVDFAFDVSEQIAPSDSTDPMGDSFSSLMEISESQILGGSPATPSVNEGLEADANAQSDLRQEQEIVAGYDVSSSDLATATDDGMTGSGTSDAPSSMPEPEPLIEVPDLPAAYQPSATTASADSGATADRAAPAEAEPITGGEGLFDGLATGSPLDEIEAPTSFEAGTTLDAEEDLLEPEVAIGAGAAAAFTAAAAIGASEASETEFDSPPAIDPGSEDSGDFQVGSPAMAEGADRAIPDLSPIMEQRIHETLEKVAWEAFSDLSESIVKQVMGRVEQIAWEVIPEMAETLVREEIRKMKGEED